MARRIAWTSNSSGHDGTRIYRDAAPMDPQALPTPLATVAAGVTEYIDGETLPGGDYDYAARDFESTDSGQLSEITTISIEPTLDTAQIGDEIGGGIYAGTHSDGTKSWHLIFAKQSGSSAGMVWGEYGHTTGATDDNDGLANQAQALSNPGNLGAPPFVHCRDYVDTEGNSDYYLPSRNEVKKLDTLWDMGHPEFANLSTYHHSSTEYNSGAIFSRLPSESKENTYFNNKQSDFYLARPARRVLI